MQPVAFLAVSFCLALGPDAAAGPVDYVRDVKPLLARHCVSCHGARLTRGLRLDTAAAALKGGSRAVDRARQGRRELSDRRADRRRCC